MTNPEESGIDGLEQFVKQAKKYEKEEKYIYLNGGIVQIDRYCDRCEEVIIEGMHYVYQVIEPVYPSEEKIERIAIQRVIYEHIGKVFVLKKKAIEDYIDGYLTFKGLIRKLDPMQLQSIHEKTKKEN